MNFLFRSLEEDLVQLILRVQSARKQGYKIERNLETAIYWGLLRIEMKRKISRIWTENYCENVISCISVYGLFEELTWAGAWQAKKMKSTQDN